MTKFTVLGIGADPRMYGYRPVSSLAASENAYEYISVYRDRDSWFLILLFESGLLDVVVEALFGLLLGL